MLDYYAIDSWDNEWAYVYLGESSRKVWNRTISHTNPGGANSCGAGWADAVYHVELSGTDTGGAWTYVTVGAGLNSAANDESFGIDNVEIWVR